jgi:hypothetical protein
MKTENLTMEKKESIAEEETVLLERRKTEKLKTKKKVKRLQ